MWVGESAYAVDFCVCGAPARSLVSPRCACAREVQLADVAAKPELHRLPSTIFFSPRLDSWLTVRSGSNKVISVRLIWGVVFIEELPNSPATEHCVYIDRHNSCTQIEEIQLVFCFRDAISIRLWESIDFSISNVIIVDASTTRVILRSLNASLNLVNLKRIRS